MNSAREHAAAHAEVIEAHVHVWCSRRQPASPSVRAARCRSRSCKDRSRHAGSGRRSRESRTPGREEQSEDASLLSASFTQVRDDAPSGHNNITTIARSFRTTSFRGCPLPHSIPGSHTKPLRLIYPSSIYYTTGAFPWQGLFCGPGPRSRPCGRGPPQARRPRKSRGGALSAAPAVVKTAGPARKLPVERLDGAPGRDLDRAERLRSRRRASASRPSRSGRRDRCTPASARTTRRASLFASATTAPSPAAYGMILMLAAARAPLPGSQ